MTPIPQAAIDAANATEDDLLLELGQQLVPDPNRDNDPTDLKNRARDWLNRERRALAELLCGNPAVKHLHNNAADIAVLADMIATATGRPPVYTVAAIILKRGLDWLCSTQEPTST